MSARWSSTSSELHPVAPYFWAVVRANGVQAAESGARGEGGGFVWSVGAWKRFIAAAESERHLAIYGGALVNTVQAVKALLADGKSAREIHAALYWASRKIDNALEDERRRQREMQVSQKPQRRPRRIIAQGDEHEPD